MYLLLRFLSTLAVVVHACCNVGVVSFESGWFSDIAPPEEQSPEIQSSMREQIPNYLYDLYEDMRYQDEGLDPTYGATRGMYHHGQTIRSFRVREQRVPNGVWHNVRVHMMFNISGLPEESNITSAELVVPIRNYRLMPQHTRAFHRNFRLQKITDHHEPRRFLVFNIPTSYLTRRRHDSEIWFKVITSRFLNVFENVLNEIFVLDETIVVVYENLDPGSLHHSRTRRRRDISSTFSSSLQLMEENQTFNLGATVSPDSPICGLRPWYINFTSLSWYWILQPTGYNANICSGECMTSLESITSNYGIVKAQFHLHSVFSNVNSVSLPVCTPSRLTSISIIYYNSEYNLVSKRLPEMKVLQCDCR